MIVSATVVWWGLGRISAPGRRLVVERPGHVATSGAPSGAPSGATIRILAWNIAHGRGNLEQGIRQNWMGGSGAERLERLERMAAVLRDVDADIVALNEVDFDAVWSKGLNQAAYLARRAGYPYRVEQRNFDFRVPFGSWAFGNAVLSRLPIVHAEWVDLPARSRWESLLMGSKEAVVVRLGSPGAELAVVPLHLEFRPGDTRLRAVPVLEAVRVGEPAPLVLAGDFNTAPPDWTEVRPVTAVGELLRLGWRSARAERPPSRSELTFPTYDLRDSRDWILVEPSLEVVDARIVAGAALLSDHVPVVADVRLPGTDARGDPRPR